MTGGSVALDQAMDEAFPLATFTSLLEAAAMELADTTFGLNLGRDFHISAFGKLGALMQAAPNMGEAISAFVGYFGLVQTNTTNRLSVSNGVARLSYAITDNAVRCRVQDANFTIAMEDGFLRTLLGPAWRKQGVELAHGPDDMLDAYQAQFDCPLRFGATHNAILFPAALLARQPLGANEARFNMLRAELDDELRLHERRLDWQSGLEAWINACLCHGLRMDIEDAAADFGLSQRSLQRRLTELGLNFMQLRNQVRTRLGQSLLIKTSLPITAIGERLGYSETSAFSRAFRAQTGLSPVSYRRRGGLTRQ
ncbi:AraC-like transcriptional regulator QhpR [Acidocella sp.]|uniref:AraC-like transcriptional regulator QhpR n=1 Tax=Acidocella sp. TaxID=50710 RepID=UPI003CFF6BD5